MKFARIADGSVQELIEVADLDDLKTRFTPDSVKEWVEANDSTELDMTWDGTSFGAAKAKWEPDSEEQRASAAAIIAELEAMTPEERWAIEEKTLPETYKNDAALLEKSKNAFIASL